MVWIEKNSTKRIKKKLCWLYHQTNIMLEKWSNYTQSNAQQSTQTHTTPMKIRKQL